MNCFGTSPAAQTFPTPDRPKMNQGFVEAQTSERGRQVGRKPNPADSRCYTRVATGAESLQV